MVAVRNSPILLAVVVMVACCICITTQQDPDAGVSEVVDEETTTLEGTTESPKTKRHRSRKPKSTTQSIPGLIKQPRPGEIDPVDVFNRAEPSTPTKKIGDECGNDQECKSAYSACVEDKCTCRDGFSVPSGGTDCVASKFDCPFGEPLKSGGSVQACERMQVIEEEPQDCVNPFTPMIIPPNAILCPVSPMAIGRRKKRQPPGPIMVPMAIGGFPRMPQKMSLHFNDSCPEDAYCMLYTPFNGQIGTGHCCPKPKASCPVGSPDPEATCGRPVAGRKQKANGGYCNFQTHFCYAINVGAQEVQNLCCPKPCRDPLFYHEGKCYARMSAGDSCEIDEQCLGSNSECHDGKCKCKKGFVADRNGYCTQPYCPSDGAPLTAVADADGNPIECTGNATSCNSKSYCNPSYKVCCPIPEAFCPDTQSHVSPNDRCDINILGACGVKKYCKFWYSEAGQNASNSQLDQTNGLCCPIFNSFRPPIGGPFQGLPMPQAIQPDKPVLEEAQPSNVISSKQQRPNRKHT